MRVAGIFLGLGLICAWHPLLGGASGAEPRSVWLSNDRKTTSLFPHFKGRDVAEHAPASRQAPAVRVLKATNSRAAREDAVRSIPTKKLDADAKAKVTSVLSGAGLFRRMPIHVIQCDPDLYLFLVRHPDVVANIWEVLKVARLSVRQTQPGAFRVADGEGTVGKIEFLYSNHDTQLIYTEGSYEGPLLKQTVRGRGLMILKTGYIREPDGRYYITSRLDSFTNLESGAAELLTKVFEPLVGKIADANFIQTANFLGGLSRAAEANHGGIERMADRLLHVQPEVRQELAELAKQTAERRAQLLAKGPPSRSAIASGRPHPPNSDGRRR